MLSIYLGPDVYFTKVVLLILFHKSLGVKDKSIIDVSDSFDISKEDGNSSMSKTTAEALMMLLLS